MGEAKRRKQRDHSYRLVYQVRSSQHLERHVEKLFKDLSEQWYENLKSTNVNSDEVTKRLAGWVQQQLSSYKEPDRQVLANALISTYAAAGGDYLVYQIAYSKLEWHKT